MTQSVESTDHRMVRPPPAKAWRTVGRAAIATALLIAPFLSARQLRAQGQGEVQVTAQVLPLVPTRQAALAFAALYLPLSWFTLKRWPERGRRLVVTFLALGAGFTTLAIPLALSARYTSMAWALEGLGILWVGLMAPAGTPKAVIDKMGAAVVRAVASREFSERLLRDGIEPVGSTADAFAALISKEIVLWRELAKSAKISLD